MKLKNRLIINLLLLILFWHFVQYKDPVLPAVPCFHFGVLCIQNGQAVVQYEQLEIIRFYARVGVSEAVDFGIFDLKKTKNITMLLINI